MLVIRKDDYGVSIVKEDESGNCEGELFLTLEEVTELVKELKERLCNVIFK